MARRDIKYARKSQLSTSGGVDHTLLANIGTNTHAQIDTHIADATLHFTEGSIDHTAITNIGTNTHAQIDTHIADATLHFTEASIDHGSISGLADDDHTQYLLVDGTRALTDNLLFSDATGAVIDVTTNSSTLTIQGRTSVGGTVTMIDMDPDGFVQLYKDGEVTAYTNNSGMRIAGKSGQDTKLTWYVAGNSLNSAAIIADTTTGDFKIQNQNATTIGDLYIDQYHGGAYKTHLKANAGGSTDLYHNNTLVFSTINDSSSYDGVRIRGISGSERPSVVLTDSAGTDKAVFAAWSDNQTYFDNRVDPSTGGGDFVLRTANHTGATILNATLTLKGETGNGADDERILVKHGNTDTLSTYDDGSGPGLSVFGAVPSIWLGDDDSMTNPYFFLRRAGTGKVNMRAMNPTDNFDLTTRTGDELSHDLQIRMHAETGVDTFDANVALYYNNSIALRTTDSGIYVRDRGGDDPRISMLDSTDVTKFRIEHVGGVVSKLVGMEHGVPVQIRAENNSGTETTCLQVDPDAEVGLFHAGTKVLRTIAPGVVVGDQGGAAGDQFLKIIADNDNTVEAANAYIQLEQDGAAVISQIGTTGNANTMPDGTAITIGSGSGIKANSLALINKFSTGSIGFVVGSTAELIIDSTGCGFNGKTPVAVPTYTVTNDVTDRTYDANSTSVAELADVLGTLIADLQANGLLN